MPRIAPILAFLLAVVTFADPASANAVRVFEAQQGAWKASCYKDPGSDEPYCHLMVIHTFADGSKTGNFVRFGPVFDRDKRGVVVASYLGFAKKSKISIQVDMDGAEDKKWSDPAPKTNHLVIPEQVSGEILTAMEAGQSLRLKFKPATGIAQNIKVSLTDYRDLLKAVTKVLAGETVSR
ncbi:invasion associated locus B family protein [Magnetospira sp. QH-2]|uniref:invasion associated locus B family protein n=1 Tax=Magnetospira sp. (strain QH-2) TaxID=1288970 RepID=UPI0003E81A96|nr:invasion associated locus B family protein [Magnetospira sp. QH-2]CCQ72580.1 protein of unknown function [Magnetospira sp. QH-2]